MTRIIQITCYYFNIVFGRTSSLPLTCVCDDPTRRGDPRRRIDLPSTIYSYALSAPPPYTPPAGWSVGPPSYVTICTKRFSRACVRVCVQVCKCALAYKRLTSSSNKKTRGKKITQIDKTKERQK